MIDPEKQKATYKRYKTSRKGRKMHRAAHRRYRLKNLYGITDTDYQKMRENQKGLCAICDQPERRKRKDLEFDLSVDHDHATKKVRALLCNWCNVGLGSFKDDPALLEKAVAYLKAHSSMGVWDGNSQETNYPRY